MRPLVATLRARLDRLAHTLLAATPLGVPGSDYLLALACLAMSASHVVGTRLPALAVAPPVWGATATPSV